jgi:hypothetical protein
VFLLLGCSLALCVIFLLPLNVWLKSVLSMVLSGFLLIHLLRDAWLLLPTSIEGIRIDGGDIALISRVGNELSCSILQGSVVTPLLTILNVRQNATNRVRSVVIFPDSMSREGFRELRVLLKWNNNLHD